MVTKIKELTHFHLAQLKDIPQGGGIPQQDGLDWIDAKPGRAIHYDLIEANKLENPYSGHDASVKVQWVSQADWLYKAEFDLTSDIAGCGRYFIELDCVDTFADVYVNGKLVGTCSNMFIPWAFELHGLKEKGNSLVIHVKGHSRMVAHKADKAVEMLGPGRGSIYIRERSLVRRYQRSYAEDFNLLGQGIWGIGLVRPVNILGYSEAFINESEFSVSSIGLPECKTATASVRVEADTGGKEGSYTATAILTDRDGNVASQGSAALADGKGAISLSIAEPKLWWPNGSGEQYLYDLKVTLSNGAGELHTITKQVGIKEIALIKQKPSGRHDFQFVVNGKPTYIKGSNIIPVDVLNGGGTPEQVENLVKLAVNANMNLVRLWGGGMHEPDWFYKLFDKYGIMLWMDGHLHSHPYPDYDDEFVEEVKNETIIMLKQLRSHACFAIFCGGNEQQEGWDAWGWKMTMDRFYGAKLLYDEFPKIAAQYCPEIPYIPNSPHGEKLSQSPVDGETHTWGNFYNATEDPLFVTETCWYAGTISRPETLEKWMGIKVDDYSGKNWNINWQQRTSTALWQINQFTEYHMNSSLRAYARGLELEQMTADYMSLYYVRVRGPSCTGIIYWPLNKGGIMMNYGCVDYDRRPLMPYYQCARLFKPVLIHAYRDSSDIRVRATNDGDPFNGLLTLTLFDTLTGQVLDRAEQEVAVPSGAGHCLFTQPDWYDGLSNRWRQAMHVKLSRGGGETVSEDFLLFCPLFEVETAKPAISIKADKLGCCEWELTLSSDQYIKLVELECSERAMLSDNYFMLMPGTTRKLKLTLLNECENADECVSANAGEPTLDIYALDHESDAVRISL
ncbi:MAG: hypothetical protein FWH01_03215 [Oscillospiraceae bacterium]|nr:hypothetical protein [Oscillospiraceae bacterium]